MKIRFLFAQAAVAALVSTAAFADDAVPVPSDVPTEVNGVEVVCTGIGDEAKSDPRWPRYPVRLEFAGGENQYLADLDVWLSTDDDEPFLGVRCDGPWLLVDLSPGTYTVTAVFEGRLTKTATFTASASGQKRVVVHFPEVIGAQ
jgi:hypothetical protein